MKEILYKSTVLVLNRNWQAIEVKAPAEAFCMMAVDTATALDIQEGGSMCPIKWADWLKLPVRENDECVHTVHGAVRVPTVIVLANYAKVPKRRPKLNPRGIWERDGGVCQYTGRKLQPGEGSIDHVIPRSRGGATSWENCVLSDRQINTKKGDRLPEEAGLLLRRKPVTPREMPATECIRNTHEVRDWELFLKQRKRERGLDQAAA